MFISSTCRRAEMPRWDLCHPAENVSRAVEPIATTDNLVVYLDTSLSMAGYVSPNAKTAFAVAPDGRTIFSKTLLELRNVVTTLSPQPQVVVRKVDANVSAPSYSDLDLSQASVNRSLYNGKETNLAGAIKSFSKPLNPDAEDQSPPRFHILVTDGVQSSAKNNSELNCAQGSDSFCVKKQLLELMNSGWGGAVIGLRSEFNGIVYSEVSHQQVQFSSGKDAAKFRPFYLYVFSSDRAALDKLVDSLRQRLAPLGSAENFREFVLTSDYAIGPGTIEISQNRDTRDLLEVRKEKVKEGENSHVTVKTELATAAKGAQQFVVSIKPAWTDQALAVGSPDDLASLVKWQAKQTYPDNEDAKIRYPNFKLVKQEIKNGAVELTFETGFSPGTGSAAWRMFDITGTLDVDHDVPPWVASWSTNLDTTADVGNKTLNIESSLANLWKNSALQDYPVAEICVRVGEK